jgi:nucleoside 2-deoxyribosyltransferase
VPTPPAELASVYVSSPLGFSAFGRWSMARLYEKMEAAELEVRDPWRWPSQRDSEPSIRTADLLGTALLSGPDSGWKVSREIAARNVTELRAAEAVLAILDGTDVDSGVAAEVGYASAISKPVIGLRTDERNAADGSGYPVNLQVTHLIANSSQDAGLITASIDEAIDALLAIASIGRDAS